MELVSIKELYREKESFIGKKITVGDGSEVLETLKHLDLLY